MEKEKEKEDNINNYTEVFYSPKGYIKVSKEDYESSQTNIKYVKSTKVEGEINKSELTKNITIDLKTFYGKRNKYPIEVNVTETLSDLIFQLISIEANQTDNEETFNIKKQFKLISPLNRLKELCLYKTYKEEDIQNNSTILLLPADKYRFSKVLKGPHCYLENKAKDVLKEDVDDLEFCLIDTPLIYGKIYIEFILKCEPIEKNIIIGVTKKRSNFKNFNDSNGFYGYILSDCKLVYNTNGKKETKNYGFTTQIGDKIGMMVDLNKTDREVSFFINGTSAGVAFKDLPLELLYPCLCLGFPGTRVEVIDVCEFPN